jgi:very-short-patch-repair endonuclease
MRDRIPIRQFASKMRFQPTTHEMLMWNALLEAFKPYSATVRVQEPIGPYIADFFIAPCNVVIEVDGHTHKESIEHDKRRDTFMQGKGITVMRFKNHQVRRSPTACAKYVLSQCLPLKPRDQKVRITYCPPGSAIHRKEQLNPYLPTLKESY